MLTIFGAVAVTFMMVMYALESRGGAFVLAFACGCALSSSYGFLAGTWPFGVVEAIWALIAVRRYRQVRANPTARAHRPGAKQSQADGSPDGRDALARQVRPQAESQQHLHCSAEGVSVLRGLRPGRSG